MTTINHQTGAGDFDFFMGNWDVTHQRLKERLANCQEWITFKGTTAVEKILNGFGNIDDNLLHFPDGAYRAATLRSFDASAGLWSIWWLDGRYPGNLDTPMRGSFNDGVGSFYAEDVFAGKAIRVRFLWTMPATDRPRWEQAFSTDGGASWETNWIMDFKRGA
ncbi:DUF1579 domain-containing protein [Undibacterium sp. TJN19]|uniref:DUF1579 domain-containing protein n=1 Tax=Undibacterium sp. TJN19 TaxID=3413055 RepID=UPI003BF3AD1E